MSQKTIVILTGQGFPAIAAANIYQQRLQGQYRLVIVEEENVTVQKGLAFLKKRFQKKGLPAVLDALLLRLLKPMLWPVTAITKNYVPSLIVQDLNAPQVSQLIRAEQPEFVITNACSILKKDFLAQVPCPILNVHNGITPRYRGTGNFWAFYENNPALVGTTIHYLDEGIDTGEPIARVPLDFKTQPASFEDIDVVSFQHGATMIADFILEGQVCPSGPFENILDGYYSYPGFTEYWQARRHFLAYCQSNAPVEAIWQESFESLAQQEEKSIYQRMHWHDDQTVSARDNLVKRLFEEKSPPGDCAVLDIGCGDGRYETLLPGARYTGCDYSLNTMQLGQNPNLVHCRADDMPFENDQFDCSIAVGLFQHLQNAQQVADEIRRVTKPQGTIIINTLRQFSWLELLIIAVCSIGDLNRLRLVWAILRRDYFRGLEIDQQLVARRYSPQELKQLFKTEKTKPLSVYYNGLGQTALFAREMTVVIDNPPVKKPCHQPTLIPA